MSDRDVDICPSNKRNQRACLLCSLVKTQEQFLQDGCDNCEHHLHLQGDLDRVYECTSVDFFGIVAMMDRDKTWVGRWQRTDKFKPGCYALTVHGRLPGHIVQQLSDKNIHYRPRDAAR
eukprot:m.15547 g.15547  ORF g.15547 m.15547 type:complete len:119 (-) comp7402_c0_seq2:234-590(-)